MLDVVSQVFHEVGIWVVRDDDMLSAVKSAYKARQTGACTKFKHSISLHELICALLQIV